MAKYMDSWGAGFQTTAPTTRISRPLFNLFYRESQLVNRPVLRDWVLNMIGTITFAALLALMYTALATAPTGDELIISAKGGF